MATQNQPNHPTDVVLHATVIQGAAGFTITNHDDLSYENVVLSCEACLRSGGRNTRVELSASAPDIDVGQSVSLPFSALQYEDSNTPFDSRRLRLTRVTVTCEVGYADGSFSQQLGPEPEGEVPID